MWGLALLLRSWLTALPAFTAATGAEPNRPNVVLIIGDDQGWEDFGFMGHPVIRTPCLDKLAAAGALFPHGYVPTSLCRASLATILTGLYPHQHKITFNDPPKAVDRTTIRFIEGVPTIPRLLGTVGYRSFQTGKYWEGHYRAAGFTAGMTVKGRHGDEGLIIGRQTMQPIYDFIAAEPKKPFFLWYAPMLPHTPHNPPQRLLEKYQAAGRELGVAKYHAMCEWFDETCGELLDYLDQQGLAKNTLVVFVVDNGWVATAGEPGARGGPRGKNTPYEGGVRTPVILRWPGRIKPGRYTDLVSSIDLAPTILTACGVEKPQQMPGLNLLEVSEGKGPLARNAVFGELFLHTAADVNNPAANLLCRWVREGAWKLILDHAGQQPPELYNLGEDPKEAHNLAVEQPDRVQHLRNLLDRWWNPTR
jgi:uncharacterized sulfatase